MGTIRFLLALAVIIEHSSPVLGVDLVPGYLAVQSFYIISGFLMAMVICEKYNKTQNSFYLFITNRFLRLYPLFVLIVILTVMLSIVLGITLGSYGKLQYYFNFYDQSPQSLAALWIIFISNFLMIGQDIVSFLNINPDTGNFYFLGLQSHIALQELLMIPIGWTVAVEFTFYLFAPYVARKELSGVLGIICLVLFFRFLLYITRLAPTDFYIYRFAPTEFFWFLLGIAAYKIKLLRAINRKWIAGTGIVLIVFFMLFYNYWPVEIASVKDTVFFVSIFLFSPVLFYQFSQSKIDKFMGDLCYPMYLGHILVSMIVMANSFPKPYGSGLPTAVLTVLFAVSVNQFFLLRIERFRQKRILRKSVISHHG